MSDHTSGAGVIVEGSAKVSEQDREAYLELVRAVVAASAKKRGCLKFAVAEDIGQRNLFHLTELWTDRECLDASRFGTENLEILRQLATLDVRDRRVLIYHVSQTESG
jgi:quinol monooxygenase YgiN